MEIPKNVNRTRVVVAGLLGFVALGVLLTQAFLPNGGAVSPAPGYQSNAGSAVTSPSSGEDRNSAGPQVTVSQAVPPDLDWAYELAMLSVKLLIVLVLIWGTVWVLKRYVLKTKSASGYRSVISVLESQQLGANRAIYVVRAGEKVLVIGATGGQMSLLTEITDAKTLEYLSIRQDASGLQPFSNYLQSVLNRTIQMK